METPEKFVKLCKITERRLSGRSIVNFEQVSHIVPVFALLTLNNTDCIQFSENVQKFFKTIKIITPISLTCGASFFPFTAVLMFVLVK